jgi:hypothetical protein
MGQIDGGFNCRLDNTWCCSKCASRGFIRLLP